jgi:hypothetical protein
LSLVGVLLIKKFNNTNPVLLKVTQFDTIYIFLNKEHILISGRYQLHPVYETTHFPSGITDAHSWKKEELQKKSYYIDIFLETTVLTPPRQHQKSSFTKSDASKNKTMHKCRRCLIIDINFHH